jgi:hypothetical protein
MTHLISTKSLAAVALALGAIASASSAQARSDVQFSIGVQVPGLYLQSGPVYAQPRPIYMPAPVYYERYEQPRPVYMPAPIQYGRFDEGRRFGGHHWQGRGPNGDMDRDGVVNRYDGDRDGDGVRNRYDRLPNNPYRR